MIAALFAGLLALLLHLAPTVAAPVAQGHVPPVTTTAPRAVAATPSHGPASADGARSSVLEQRPASPVTVPACHGIEVWDGEHCVAEQLPAEAAGGDRDPAH